MSCIGQVAGLILLLAASTPGLAAPSAPGVSDVSEVVVTGSRLTEYDPVQTPQVTLVRRADNLVTEVKVTCDTRDQSQRRDELKATLRNMIRAAAQDHSVELGLGDEVIGSFDETMLDAVIAPDARADTSSATVVIKTKVSAADSFDAATGRITAFIAHTPKVGRTEILRQGDWQLTLIGPQRYRPDVIALVAADAKKVAGQFGLDFAVTVDGLQRPVSWYQAGPLDLALYIPYRLVVGSPMAVGAVSAGRDRP